MNSEVEYYYKFKPLYFPDKKYYRFFVAYGGRGGMKTYEFSQALVLRGAKEKLNIICGRQFQNSIEDSVKSKIEAQIIKLGLQDEYNSTDTKIVHRLTGTTFKFKGLERNIESSKGWDEVDILWIEEGEVLKQRTIEILFPSIRKPGSKILISMNTGKRSDPIHKRFLSNNSDLSDTVLIKTYWWENKHHPKELEIERKACLKTMPERYQHIWEGAPDDNAGGSRVLTYENLLKCVDAHIKLRYKPSGAIHSGLDVADEGNDTNSYAKRQGPLLSVVREWKVKYLHMTAKKADFMNNTFDVSQMYYDAGGLGAGIKSDLSRIKSNPHTGTGPGVKRFVPFLFGGKVKGPNTYYIKHKTLKIKNQDYFHRANSQLWWNIKLRVENTLKALDGESIDLSKCFFIDSKIDNLDKILSELCQCVYDDSTGKIKVDKAPDGAPSPNLADSIILAYASDIKKGLKANY